MARRKTPSKVTENMGYIEKIGESRRTSSSSSRSPTFETTEEQIQQITQDLQNTTLSEAKQYALKKQLKILQAKKKREVRLQEQQL